MCLVATSCVYSHAAEAHVAETFEVDGTDAVAQCIYYYVVHHCALKKTEPESLPRVRPVEILLSFVFIVPLLFLTVSFKSSLLIKLADVEA